MEFFDLIDGVKEDKHLGVVFPFLVQFLENGPNDVLMHICAVVHDFVVIFDSF